MSLVNLHLDRTLGHLRDARSRLEERAHPDLVRRVENTMDEIAAVRKVCHRREEDRKR